MDIRDVRERLLPELREAMFFLTAGYPIAEVSDKLEAISEMFQALGICYFLADLDQTKFRDNLVRSGHARRYFLQKSVQQGNDNDRRLALSRTEAFLDSVAAGDFALAREIASLSPAKWTDGWEYQDDFCYFLFLHGVVGGHPANELRAILDHFETALDGARSGRLRVCTTLLDRDGAGFFEALKALMESRQEQIDQQRTGVMPTQLLFWPRSFVSVEGLALLKIAEHLGMGAQGDFPLCPLDARLPTLTQGATPDLFASLQRAMAGQQP